MPGHYVGELKVFPLQPGSVPAGWAPCDRTLLPKATNQALFDRIGNAFGGDQSQFALPDLRGATPVGVGPNGAIGDRAGEYTHALSVLEMPVHNHTVPAMNVPGSERVPVGAVFGAA